MTVEGQGKDGVLSKVFVQKGDKMRQQPFCKYGKAKSFLTDVGVVMVFAIVRKRNGRNEHNIAVNGIPAPGSWFRQVIVIEKEVDGRILCQVGKKQFSFPVSLSVKQDIP